MQMESLTTFGFRGRRPRQLTAQLVQEDSPLGSTELELIDTATGRTIYAAIIVAGHHGQVERALSDGAPCDLTNGYRLEREAMYAIHQLLHDNGFWDEEFLWGEPVGQALGRRHRLSPLAS